MKAIINATIYTGEQKIENGYLLYTDKIEKIGKMDESITFPDEVIDAKGNIIIPGMIDVHVHGGYEVDVMDGDAEAILKMSESFIKEGVTSFFPTTMTQDHGEIKKAVQACKQAKEMGATIEGIHVEGPFVSKVRAGAQPLEYICKPDVSIMKEWQEESGRLVKLVTYAPEEEGAKELEAYFKEEGIVGTAGHTDAVYDTFSEHHVTHFTHLYNQMRGLHHREPGVVGYALLSDDAYVEIIPDGIHIHPKMVELAYKLKGAKRVVVITDAMRAKGLADGLYELGGQPVHVKDGSARLDDGTLAGSIIKMIDAFKNIIKFTGCSIEEAVQMTSVNQAEEFNLTQKGALKVGKDADFLMLNDNLDLLTSFSRGRNFQ